MSCSIQHQLQNEPHMTTKTQGKFKAGRPFGDALLLQTGARASSLLNAGGRGAAEKIFCRVHGVQF